MTWRVTVHPEASVELAALPEADQDAIINAIEKLKVQGVRLGAPHSSSIRGTKETLRELRPRAGRSRWRAFYRRIGDQFLIAAIGPEASVSAAGFRRSVADALARLSTLDIGDNNR
jgi:mRNA-degrading endonuclease RelE of RelBE toxin-antitoxin system